MCEYAVSVKYADNKYCHDNHFIGEYIQIGTITTDWNKAKEYLNDINNRIASSKRRYHDMYVEESAKIMVREVTDWCEALNKE